MFEKYLVKVLEFKKKNCVELVPVAELNGVISLTKLFDALGTVKNGVGTINTCGKGCLFSGCMVRLLCTKNANLCSFFIS